ncbi:MAG TPA: glycosyltransferase [Fibrobacteria bacterium]|nr:glycosyltransferase [Fibrobacteria bacterium]
MTEAEADRSHKWMVVLPPEGAARQVGEKAWEALGALLPAGNRKLFDTKAYLDAFDRLLKNPADDMVVDLANQALVVQCLDFGATHLLVVALSPVTRFTVDLLRRQGITPLHWFIEDFREAKYWKDVLPAYGHFLAIQRGPVERACAEAGVRYGYMPTAAILKPRPAVKAWRERSDGIAFIGFPSAYRVEVLEAMAREGLPLKVAGLGWEKYRGPLEAHLTGRGWFGPEEAFKLLENARIGLHLPSEDPAADRGNSHVSPRVFDILAAGCLLLSEEAPLIRETLKECAIREFRGPAEAVRAARTALAEGVADEVLAANRALVLRDHSFERRMREVLELGGTAGSV